MANALKRGSTWLHNLAPPQKHERWGSDEGGDGNAGREEAPLGLVGQEGGEVGVGLRAGGRDPQSRPPLPDRPEEVPGGLARDLLNMAIIMTG